MINKSKARALSLMLTVPMVASMCSVSSVQGAEVSTSAASTESTSTESTSTDSATGASSDDSSKTASSNETTATTKTSSATTGSSTEENDFESGSSNSNSASSTSTEESDSSSSSSTEASSSESSSSTESSSSDSSSASKKTLKLAASASNDVTYAAGSPSNSSDGYNHSYKVWDLAGDQFADTDNVTYSNMITEDDINAIYDDSVTVGSSGNAIGSFDFGNGFSFYSAKDNNRLRTTNTNLTRYDEKSKTDASGNVYRGYIYSNSSSTSETGITLSNLEKGDIVRIIAGSNSNTATYAFGTTKGDAMQTESYTKSAGLEELTFYAESDGDYSVWVTDEKLVVARVYIESADDITLSGDIDVDGSFECDGASLLFSQITPDGDVIDEISCDIVDDGDGTYSYSVSLQKMYDYSVELVDGNGYVVDTTDFDDGTFTIENVDDDTMDKTISLAQVETVTVSGEFENLSAEAAESLVLTIENNETDSPYEAVLTKVEDSNEFTLELESGVTYDLSASGIEDYELETTTICADEDCEKNIVFNAKDLHNIDITVSGIEDGELSNLTLSFTILKTPITGELDEDYVYTFTGSDIEEGTVALRDGQYKISATLEGYELALTADLKVDGEDTSKEIVMEKTSDEEKTIEYASVVTVGSGKDYETISDALDAVRCMDRDEDSESVTIKIDPGNYEEMLYIDVDNVSFVNASDDASIELSSNGTDIDDNAVRITSYYGHGYTYYSMDENYRYNSEVLAVNLENGYPSVTNPGAGTSTMWNATVIVDADGFSAEGIIFENSFNQYVSSAAAGDKLVAQSGAKEGSDGARADLEEGSTVVQQKAYVERAAALAIGNGLSDITFDNCKFVGRQDTLYGGKLTYAEFTNCSVYGSVDYIFGGMTAIFNKCDLVFNTTDNKNDVGYITAAQQSTGRGYLMYECHITSVTAGVDVDSAYYSYTTSKPGYFGRPWQANTSEVVFYNTTIDACDSELAEIYGSDSLIMPEGWLKSLGGESMVYEYGTTEESGADYSASRISSWTTWLTSDSVIDTPYLQDGTEITLDAFRENKSSEKEHTWQSSAFGTGISTDYDIATVNSDGTVTLSATNGKGKLIPATTDGVIFYYTTIDAEDENFTLEADISVDSWKLSNGQEGFGIMACDRVGENGDSSTYWNNSYMLVATKTSYTGDNGTSYTMKLGVGAQEKKGITTEALSSSSPAAYLTSTMYTLETYAADENLDAGTYNLIGNYSSNTGSTDLSNLVTNMHVSIKRNNTGYTLTCSDMDGNVIGSKLFYYEDGVDPLTSLDEDNIYVGFFAARNATVTVSNISLTTVDPDDDDPAEEHPIEYTDYNGSFISSTIANSTDYTLRYYGNADGTLSITDSNGNVVLEETSVSADTKLDTIVTLTEGDNTFTATFTPDSSFKFSKYNLLSSYDATTFSITVNYDKSTRYVYYVSPDGTSTGDGSRENPLDIYSAVKKVEAGDKIVLMSGTYNLTSTITVERGIDGTEDAMIYMIAENEDDRPVFDFGGNCAGMVLAGNYWYFKGFDVTNSANAKKGLQLSGSYNVLDNIHAYKNGNTGIQISRYLSSDEKEDWPAYNTVLNCSSFLNADAGYEDADGFAAKLTVGDGNVFDGCIAAYNADDGWDLFAKAETGSIGSVTIQNCVAFRNGYILDENGDLIDAGNGNGFKMGGSSISGYHHIINSVAFGNKAKGIDSNSCPDIIVTNCTTFNNESYNTALYTNDASDTAFVVNGIISYRNDGGVNDQFKLKGDQNTEDVYGEDNYYVIDGVSTNSVGDLVDDTWFVSVDMDTAIGSSMTSASTDLVCGITRNSDGTINMNGFLELADSTSTSGATVSGTSSSTVTVTEKEAMKQKDDSEDLNGEFVTKWWNVYYVLEDGTYLTGLHKIEGNIYYFAENGVMARNSFVDVNGYTYYFDEDGKAVKGFMTLWGWNTYYFDNNARLVRDSFVTEGDYTYYAGSDGVLVKNDFVTITDDEGNSKTYYFDSEGHMVKDTLFERWYSVYYFDENGVMATNMFVTVDGNTYYFGHDGKMVRYWQDIDGNRYYFGDDGVMRTGTVTMWFTIYTFSEDGVLLDSHSVYENAFAFIRF